MTHNFFVFLLFLASACAGVTCPVGWTANPYHGTCIVLDATRSDTYWFNARRRCWKLYHGSLVHVDSPDVDALVVQLTGGSKVWIATNDISEYRVYRGVGQRLVRYLNWADGFPKNSPTGNQDCVTLTAAGMNDVDCRIDLPYVCEIWRTEPQSWKYTRMARESFLSSAWYGVAKANFTFGVSSKLACAKACHKHYHMCDAFLYRAASKNCSLVQVFPSTISAKHFTDAEKQAIVNGGDFLYILKD